MENKTYYESPIDPNDLFKSYVKTGDGFTIPSIMFQTGLDYTETVKAINLFKITNQVKTLSQQPQNESDVPVYYFEYCDQIVQDNQTSNPIDQPKNPVTILKRKTNFPFGGGGPHGF